MTRTVDPDLASRLGAAGQAHLVTVIEALPEESADLLEAEVRDLDIDLVAQLVGRFVTGVEESDGSGDIAPGDAIPIPESDSERRRAKRIWESGEELIRQGRVSLVLLAGGQGTRLGFAGPKGEFPFAPITHRTLFHHHAAKVAALRRRYAVALPWYLLTSPQNDEQTRAFFSANDHFGLDPDSVRFVVQGTLPAVDATNGQILLDAPDRLALSPDGHGGLLMALRRSGALDEMADEGVSTFFTFQVDNPLLRVAHPALLGEHVESESEMSSLVVRKKSPEEKMGVIARVDGKTAVVEYSDLPDELARARTADGELTYWGGSIAVHAIDVGLAKRVTEGGTHLPFHRALKKVPFVDDSGRRVEPGAPNAIKFETFLFDALPLASRTATVEVAREDDFSAIKNAHGGDSPETARVDLNRMYTRWLEAAGASVGRGPDGEPIDLEIDPRFALDADELAAKLPAGEQILEPRVFAPE
jgi:UDP-N-acetylglucosamine/UDP-N-acetylgalactosamine diphosphorylase